MIFYDFEVFAFDWLVVLIEPDIQRETVIVNDKEKLENYYSKHKNDIWVGFNSRQYDQYILKAILCGLNPKEVNDWIIVDGKPGWKFSQAINYYFKINNYDVMSRIDPSLKAFEGFMGNDIRESSVPFNIKRKLTQEELAEVIRYCRHDVEQTIEVFIQRKSDFEAQIGLLKMFNLPLSSINKTKVQLAAQILEASPKEYYDEFDISFPDTMRIEKYRAVIDWYKDRRNRDYDRKLKIDVAGIPHVFGWGGVHGAREQYFGEGYFINMDVASLYPSLMIRYNLISRSCNPDKFRSIVETRLLYKKEKNPLQAPLKIVINGTFGASKDENNPLYDPRQANNVCVYGQLLLLDLIEHLEPHCEIIQSNTDGILIKMPDGGNENVFHSLIDDIAAEWEERTGLVLEFDEYQRVFQKDVNNYVIVDSEGHYKSKGAYVKKLGDLDYDLAIVNKALIEFIVNGVPVEQTIRACNSLKDFQQIRNISGKYNAIRHGETIIPEKTIRCFASKNLSDGGLFKRHSTTGRWAKIEGTPEHCAIINYNVNGWEVPPALNVQWYVDLAKKRLADFGFERNLSLW